MVKNKRLRLIAEMARKIRAYWELKNRPQDSQRYALDYDTMTRPFTGKKLPVLAWKDVRQETHLYVTGWHVHVWCGSNLYMQVMAGRAYRAMLLENNKSQGGLYSRGKEEHEVDKVIYHDWRLVPKHEEEVFKRCEPVPEPPVRYARYPPLLRATILAQQAKQLGLDASTLQEPTLPLKQDVLLKNEYFRNPSQKEKQEGTPV